MTVSYFLKYAPKKRGPDRKRNSNGATAEKSLEALDSGKWLPLTLPDNGREREQVQASPFVRGTWEIELGAGVTVRPDNLPFVRGGKVG